MSDSFAYDSAGNATTFRGTSRSFNSANEFSGTGFAYDDRGNPTTYAGSACTFDVFNRATSLGSALTAGYRSDGMRAWKQDSSGNRTYFLYDGTSPLVEMDSDGNYNSEFVYGPAGLISHSRAGLGTVFFAYDALGSVQSVWRDTGTLVSSRVYDAYGNQAGGIVAASTYDDPEIGYGGQHAYITDPETGLAICGHRYYDPSAGRWLNRDPIGYAGGINTYRYCENNPVMGVDPSGLQVGEPEEPECDDDDPTQNPFVGPAAIISAIADAANNIADGDMPNPGGPPGNEIWDGGGATAADTSNLTPQEIGNMAHEDPGFRQQLEDDFPDSTVEVNPRANAPGPDATIIGPGGGETTIELKPSNQRGFRDGVRQIINRGPDGGILYEWVLDPETGTFVYGPVATVGPL